MSINPFFNKAVGLAFTAIVFVEVANAETLQDVLALAEGNNYGLQAARAEGEARRAAIDIEKSRLRPQLYASYDARSVLSSYSEDYASSSYKSRNSSISFRQTLFSIDDRIAIRQAELNEEFANLAEIRAKTDACLRISVAYLNALFAKDESKIHINRTAKLADLVKTTKIRMAEGRSTIIDVRQVEAEEKSARALKIASDGELAEAMDYLEEIAGTRISKIEPLNFANLVREFQSLRLSDWMRQAVNFDIEAKRRHAIANVSANEIARAKAQFYPTVAVNGSYSRGKAIYPDGVSTNLSETSQSNRSIGLTISLPIFNGLGSLARVRQAVNTQIQSQAEEELALQDARAKVRVLVANVRNGLALVEGSEEATVATRQARDAVQRAFELGKKSAFDVTVAEERLLQSDIAELRSRYQMYEQLFRLTAATGILDTSLIQRLVR
jgi:TolC family type I secretion outer membrane protein